MRRIDFFQVLYCRATDFLLTFISVSVFLLDLVPDTQGGELIFRDESSWVSADQIPKSFGILV